MNIEFYFDPCCPFSRITSRWLLAVSPRRDIDIQWRQFSLAIKNDELEPNTEPSKEASIHLASHRVHRVITASADEFNIPIINLYNDFGYAFHIEGRDFDDSLILEVLSKNQLPERLLGSADDGSLDVFLTKEVDEAIGVAGRDIGVPLIVFNSNGAKLGYFGPVLNSLPKSLDESLKIWDSLANLATSPDFYELKRQRNGAPDVNSTRDN